MTDETNTPYAGVGVVLLFVSAARKAISFALLTNCIGEWSEFTVRCRNSADASS